MEAVVDIFLGAPPDEIRVGTLEVRTGDHCVFRTDQAYRDRYPRPVLGQQFEDDLERVHHSHLRLPPFFSNLLPEQEGALRRMIARQIDVKEIREAYLLAFLGEDLPGAVRAVPRAPLTPEAQRPAAAEALGAATQLRFSLAGVQLKLSMLRDGERLTLPGRDQYGDWIVKLPDARFAQVPENECAVMTWAGAAGIEVPPCELVPVSALEGLPPGLEARAGNALAVKRFDREPDRRVHQEDFAQIFGLYAEKKYEAHNYESIAAVILNTAGPAAFEAFLDRLVFVVLSGNADAHHKNWSLRYPDGVTATPAPAYDQVATVVYPDVDNHLALNFNRSKRFQDVSRAGFRRLARKLGRDPEAADRRVREAVTRIRDVWSSLRAELPLTGAQRQALERHQAELPLAHLG